MKQLLDLIAEWNKKGHWGEVTLVFQDGKLKIIKEQKQHKIGK